MKKNIFIFILAGGLLTGCSNDNYNSEEILAKERLIIVDVTDNPIIDESSQAPVMDITRAAAYTTTETLSSFSMNYTDDYKYDFSKTGGTWSTYSWPNSIDADEKIDFYAYTGGTFVYSAADPYVSFSVEENVASQHDLLVATHKNVSYDDAGGHVSLSFSHACAIVQFNVQISNTLHGKSGDLTVNSIELKNVNKSGQCHYKNDSWEWANIGTSANFTLTNNNSTTVTTTLQPLSCGYLFMIPQTLGADAKLVITYSSGTKTAEIPLKDTHWEKGKLYTINVKLGTTLIQS
jgi:hypothetical protein